MFFVRVGLIYHCGSESKWDHSQLSLWIALIIVSLFSNPTFADQSSTASPTPTASSSSITLYDLDRICADVLGTTGSSSPTPSATSTSTSLTSTTQQKLQYCQTAKSAKLAADSNSLAWKIWAAVGTVCFAACGASFNGMTNPYVCMGASVAGALGDAAITRQFMTAMMSIMAVGGMAIMNQMNNSNSPAGLNKDEKTTSESTSQNRDYGACLLGASAVMTAFQKYSAAQSNKANAISNLTNAQPLGSSNTSYASASTGFTTTSSAATYGSTGYNTSSGSTGITSPYGAGTTAAMMAGMMGSGCAGMYNRGTYGNGTYGSGMYGSGMYGSGMYGGSSYGGMMTRCAVGVDSNLPPMVNTPKFQEDFKKASGMTLPDFVAKSDNPKQAITAALGATMSTSDTLRTAAALQNLEQQLNKPIPSSAYVSSGGGGGRNSGGSEPNLGEIMSNVMSQFGQKPGEDGKPLTGVAAIAFANQNREASAIVEDKSLNLFDRVTYRYFTVADRVREGGN